jgi:hypothetical protein
VRTSRIADYNHLSLDKITDDKGAYLIDKMLRANIWQRMEHAA